MAREREGVLYCLIAAVAYSVTAPFAKVAYAAGVNVQTLLGARYFIAAFFFWALIARTRRSLPPRATIVRGLLLGMLCQSSQTFLFASALTRIDAALAILLLYAYPAMITVAAVLLGRERFTPRRVLALIVATTGVALVLVGPRGGAGDVLGILLALGAAAVYTVTLLTGQVILRATPAGDARRARCDGCGGDVHDHRDGNRRASLRLQAMGLAADHRACTLRVRPRHRRELRGHQPRRPDRGEHPRDDGDSARCLPRRRAARRATPADPTGRRVFRARRCGTAPMAARRITRGSAGR